VANLVEGHVSSREKGLKLKFSGIASLVVYLAVKPKITLVKNNISLAKSGNRARIEENNSLTQKLSPELRIID